MSKHFVPWWTVVATAVAVFGTVAAAVGAGVVLTKLAVWLWSAL
jgi:hypothetical protein